MVPVDRQRGSDPGEGVLFLWWGGLVEGHGELAEGGGADGVMLDNDGFAEGGGFP